MENNTLTKLHSNQFQGLRNLRDLYLSYNKLELLPQGIFKDLKKLLIIEIFDNELANVSINNFKEIKQLKILKMHDNKMREIPKGFFDDVLKEIFQVSLDTNLMCCHMHKEDGDCIFLYNDKFASCKSMFKNPVPKKSMWAIGSLSLAGSVFVITWRTIFKDANAIQSIMLLHLAVSDGLMGAYLITLGAIDMLWSGEYYLHDCEWRSSKVCQITGATSLLSSEVSLMLMSLISADRLKNIVFPFSGGALTRKRTHVLCTIIWLVGFLLAFFPMFGLKYFDNPYHSFYGKSVVCLPLQLSYDTPAGWEYSVSVFFGLNSFFVIFITVAYIMIFINRIRVKNQSANSKRETGLAKRLFFLIITDCLCWMPIIVIGLRSTLEKNFKEPGDLAVWIAVFALPINSAINPILYTLATPQAQEYLGGKMARLRGFLCNKFHCNENQEEQRDPQGSYDKEQRHDEEDQNRQELQGEHQIEINEQFHEEDHQQGEMIEMQAFSLPPHEQDEDQGEDVKEEDLEFDTTL